jgi:hypothetical protein
LKVPILLLIKGIIFIPKFPFQGADATASLQ